MWGTVVGSGDIEKDTDLTPGPPESSQVKPTHSQIKVLSFTFSPSLNWATEEERVLKAFLLPSSTSLPFFLPSTNVHGKPVMLGTGDIQWSQPSLTANYCYSLPSPGRQVETNENCTGSSSRKETTRNGAAQDHRRTHLRKESHPSWPLGESPHKLADACQPLLSIC